MALNESVRQKVRDLYGYAIAQEHVGRRVLMREFDLTRTEAEQLLEEIRNPKGSGFEVESEAILVDKIENYTYHEDKDLYVFEGIDPFEMPVEFDFGGEEIRAMMTDYVGAGYTRAETATKHGLAAALFDQIRRALGWTKSDVPATDEEVRSKKVDELAEEIHLAQKRAETQKRVEKKQLRSIRKDAERWQDFEHIIHHDFLTLLREKEYGAAPVNRIFRPSEEEEKYAALVPAFDLHYGKEGLLDETGAPYDRDRARRTMIDNARRLSFDVTRFNVEKIILAFASDFFHVDDYHATTTGAKVNTGTSQDLDGSPSQMFMEGCNLMVEYIEMLRQIAPVEAFMVPGNHDRLLSVPLMMYLKAWFRDAKDVTIKDSLRARHYTSYGITLIGLDHGDGIKPKDVPGLMMAEAREMISSTKESIFVVGHKHHEQKYDVGGVTFYQVGSPSGNDRYHHNSAYTSSRKQMTALLLGETRGVHAHLNYPPLL